ncbi:MAG: DUF1559 domain-containing protein [Patescibacteria group bacterium]|nr:DUF1559 domain-containing protein [Patescibacteria group bacterium]
MGRLAWFVVMLAVLFVSCVGVWRHCESLASSIQCTNALRKIMLALDSYHQLHGGFPPAQLCDAKGTPVNSWRTLVIPYFWYNFTPGRDDYAGPKWYDYAEPWNGPSNIAWELDRTRCEYFQCRANDHRKPAITDYVAVVGPNTMWPGTEGTTRAADGSDDDKILVIEIVNSDILWMEPRDLTLEEALDAIQPKKSVGIGSYHRDGIHYITVGGEMRTLPHDIDRESLRRLLVREPKPEER